MMLASLPELLSASAARHSHLCPRQVLDVPRSDKRLLTILETYGCFADGIEVATGCTVGHRTLRIEDYGKIAATFVDVQTEQALRVAPRPDARQRASAYAANDSRHYFAQLQAYQSMPDEALLTIQSVRLVTPIMEIVSRPGVRVNCEMCGEEIINERATALGGRILCRTCAYGGYYSTSGLASGSLTSRLVEIPGHSAPAIVS